MRTGAPLPESSAGRWTYAAIPSNDCCSRWTSAKSGGENGEFSRSEPESRSCNATSRSGSSNAERPDQDGIDDAEGRGVDADAEAEREDHDREEPGMASERPGSVPQVVEKSSHARLDEDWARTLTRGDLRPIMAAIPARQSRSTPYVRGDFLSQRLLFAAAVLLAVFVPATVYAQASIAGVVTDASGAVLPGVTVEASSPVLIEGARVPSLMAAAATGSSRCAQAPTSSPSRWPASPPSGARASTSSARRRRR